MLSSLFVPWLLLPFQSSFACGVPPVPSGCPAEGEEALQVSLWQVFTHQVPQALNQPITYMGMIPVGMTAVTLALLLIAPQRHLLLVRLGYSSAIVVGLAAQGLVTYLVTTLSPLVITAAVNVWPLLALPYLVYALTFMGGLTVFSPQTRQKTDMN
jgi:hypothetical protein